MPDTRIMTSGKHVASCPTLPLAMLAGRVYMSHIGGVTIGWRFACWSTPLGCFCPPTVFSKKVISGLLIMRFTYYTKDNQQDCSRLNNCFSLRCLGPWMTHLPPVWWSTFMFRFLNVSWCESLKWWSGIFLSSSCIYSCFIHYPNVVNYFPLTLFSTQTAFLLTFP